jgi:MoaA/NifB/PqqE/SkfB family radical SAM enzyme
MSALPVATPSQGHPPIRRLPLITLYLSERCNSRCLTCDYWRQGRVDLNAESVRRLLPSLAELQTEVALISGGEPLLNPEWQDIARLLRSHGLKLWLLTSGLSLAKHARRVAELFHAVTVSLDGTDSATYKAIRGVDAFDKVCEGISAGSATGIFVGVRVTLQRSNYAQLGQFVRTARRLGARQVSFVAVDVANPHAFGRTGDFQNHGALDPEDLPIFERLLGALETDHEQDFSSGFIAESPRKLRGILQYFRAVCGLDKYPQVRCNAPEFSAVVDAKGLVSPCFFINGPAATPHPNLTATLNSEPMATLRAAIRDSKRAECATCVCSMWRDLSVGGSQLIPAPGGKNSER